MMALLTKTISEDAYGFLMIASFFGIFISIIALSSLFGITVFKICSDENEDDWEVAFVLAWIAVSLILSVLITYIIFSQAG